jgi:hypothetical protein
MTASKIDGNRHAPEGLTRPEPSDQGDGGVFALTVSLVGLDVLRNSGCRVFIDGARVVFIGGDQIEWAVQALRSHAAAIDPLVPLAALVQPLPDLNACFIGNETPQ